jgi:transglutaminase superfamily protein
MGRLLKFWSLTRREKRFFCEAGVLLVLANLSVRVIAFRHIDGFLRARWDDGARCNFYLAEEIELVNLSLSRAANLLPWKSLCLSRSIAAFIMLRRRGIPAVMVAGVKSVEDSSLLAHAWVQTARGVIGGSSENAAFTPLVRIGMEPADC